MDHLSEHRVMISTCIAYQAPWQCKQLFKGVLSWGSWGFNRQGGTCWNCNSCIHPRDYAPSYAGIEGIRRASTFPGNIRVTHSELMLLLSVHILYILPSYFLYNGLSLYVCLLLKRVLCRSSICCDDGEGVCQLFSQARNTDCAYMKLPECCSIYAGLGMFWKP